jgi:hypothetical protein
MPLSSPCERTPPLRVSAECTKRRTKRGLTKRNHLRQPRYSSSKSSTTFPFSCVALNFSFLTLPAFLSLTSARSVATSASRRAILARNLPPSSSSSEDSGRVSSIFLRLCFFFPAVAEEELA